MTDSLDSLRAGFICPHCFKSCPQPDGHPRCHAKAEPASVTRRVIFLAGCAAVALIGVLTRGWPW